MSCSKEDEKKTDAYRNAFFMTCAMFGLKTKGTAKSLVKDTYRFVCMKAGL